MVHKNSVLLSLKSSNGKGNQFAPIVKVRRLLKEKDLFVINAVPAMPLTVF